MLSILDGLQDYRYFKELYMSVHKVEEDEINIRGFSKVCKRKRNLKLSLGH